MKDELISTSLSWNGNRTSLPQTGGSYAYCKSSQKHPVFQTANPLTHVAKICPPVQKVLERGGQAAGQTDTAGPCGTCLLGKIG